MRSIRSRGRGRAPWTAAASFALAVLAASGCGDKATQQPAAPPPPAVKVAAVAQKTIPVIMQLPGTLEAVQVVDIVPRVSGYIEERYFEEGTFVKEGDPLYLIDPRPYKSAFGCLGGPTQTGSSTGQILGRRGQALHASGEGGQRFGG